MRNQVFISYHVETAGNIAKKIADRFESDGIQCWYCQRDSLGIYSKDIMDAIQACSVFIVILDKGVADRPDHVLNEINAITRRILSKKDAQIVPFLLDEEGMTDSIYYYIGTLNYVDGRESDLEEKIEELFQKVKKILNERIISEEPEYSTLISRFPETCSCFIGREKIIEQMEQFFASGEHVLFLEGIGGIGKSEAAKHYYRQNREKYDSVLFLIYQNDLCSLICDDNGLKIQGFSRKKNESDREYFERKLRQLQLITDEKTLIIVDNFDVSDDPDLKVVMEGKYHLIFTTRNTHPGYKNLKVESMRDPEVMKQIFEFHYGETVCDSELSFLYKIFEYIDYHTYGLELIAKQMAASFLTLREMSDILEKGELLKINGESVYGRKDSKTAFQHICELFNVFGLSEEEKQLLKQLAFMGIEGVPAVRFKEWTGLDSFERINQLIRKSWIQRAPGQRLVLHPLVIEVVYHELGATLNNCQEMAYRIAEFCTEGWYHSYSDNMNVLSCVQSILRNAEPFDGKYFDYLDAYIVFLWIQGKYDDAITYGHKLYEVCKRDFGEENPKTAYVAKTLAGCYYNCRKLRESIPWYKKSLDILLKCGTEYKLDLAMCYEKVARCYSWEWECDFEKSWKMFEKARILRETVMEECRSGKRILTINRFTKTDMKELKTLYSETFLEMGRMYQLQGDYKMALEYSEKYREYLLDPSLYSDEGYAYAEMDRGVCLLHMAREQYNKRDEELADRYLRCSIKSLQQALEMNRRCHGDDDMDTIDSQEYLADAYSLAKQYEIAYDSYKNAMMMIEKALGRHSIRIEQVQQKIDCTKRLLKMHKNL